MLTEKEAHAILTEFIASHGTQRDAARALGVSQQYIADIKARGLARNVPDSILKPLGLRRVTMVERIKQRKHSKNGTK